MSKKIKYSVSLTTIDQIYDVLLWKRAGLHVEGVADAVSRLVAAKVTEKGSTSKSLDEFISSSISLQAEIDYELRDSWSHLIVRITNDDERSFVIALEFREHNIAQVLADECVFSEKYIPIKVENYNCEYDATIFVMSGEFVKDRIDDFLEGEKHLSAVSLAQTPEGVKKNAQVTINRHMGKVCNVTVYDPVLFNKLGAAQAGYALRSVG